MIICWTPSGLVSSFVCHSLVPLCWASGFSYTLIQVVFIHNPGDHYYEQTEP